MSLLQKINPKPQAYDLDAFMAPGHWFFCRRIEIPSDLEKGEEEGFALLELENLSPFPLDHMNFGFCLEESGGYAFVFAAYKRRFERIDQANWRQIDAVLPDFLLGLHPEAKSGDGLVLVTETSLVAFIYDDKSSLPASFYAEGLIQSRGEEEAPTLDSQVKSFANTAKKRLGFAKERIWYANTASKWVGQVAWFGAVDENESPAARVSYSRDQLWTADLRDPELVDLVKRDERQNGFFWKSLGVLAACLGLLILGELYWAGSKAYSSYRESAIAGRIPRVDEIVSLRNTSVTLRDFQESNLMPFSMIEALYPLQEYPSIVYKKFETAGPDVLVIDAKAANQTQVTEFKKRLERYPKVSSVELSNQQNNPSGTTFTTTIRFKFGAFYELAEVSNNG